MTKHRAKFASAGTLGLLGAALVSISAAAILRSSLRRARWCVIPIACTGYHNRLAHAVALAWFPSPCGALWGGGRVTLQYLLCSNLRDLATPTLDPSPQGKEVPL